MKNNILTTLFAATLALSAETQASSLTTLFAANNSQDGNMFDVLTFGNNLTVTGFDLNFRGTGSQAVTVEVYSKGGTWVGSETNAGV